MRARLIFWFGNEIGGTNSDEVHWLIAAALLRCVFIIPYFFPTLRGEGVVTVAATIGSAKKRAQSFQSGKGPITRN